MNSPPGSRSTLERWLALLVRYWAVSMNLAFARAGYYPGFGYTHDEKAEFRSIAAKCSFGQFIVWALTVAVITLPIAAVMGVACMYPVIVRINSPAVPAAVFFLALALTIVGVFTIGLPIAMLLSSALVGRWYRVADSDLPDRAATARYFHKLWFQLTRIAIVMMLILVPLWIFAPDKFWLTGRLVVPVAAPAFLILSAAYYFSARLRRNV